MKQIFLLSAIIALFSLSSAYAQFSLSPNVEDASVFSKGTFLRRDYHPLELSKSKLTLDALSLWDTTATPKAWVPFYSINSRMDATCSRVNGLDIYLDFFFFVIETKDTMIYTNNRLTKVQNSDGFYTYNYIYTGTRTVPDTIVTVSSPDPDIVSVFTYDANNNPATTTIKVRNGATLRDSVRAVYRHDANGNLTYYKSDEWNGAAWTPLEADSITYTTDNKFSRLWVIDYSSGVADTTQASFNYDVNKRLTQVLIGSLVRGAFVPDSRRLVTTNAYHYTGFPTEIMGQELIGTAWTNSERFRYVYNGAGSITTAFIDDLEGTTWVNAVKNDYLYCGQRVGTKETVMQEMPMTLAPNPTTDQITVTLEADAPNMSVQIFDHLGKMVVAQQAKELQATVSVSNLASGIYIVKVQSGDKWATKKFVKM